MYWALAMLGELAAGTITRNLLFRALGSRVVASLGEIGAVSIADNVLEEEDKPLIQSLKETATGYAIGAGLGKTVQPIASRLIKKFSEKVAPYITIGNLPKPHIERLTSHFADSLSLYPVIRSKIAIEFERLIKDPDFVKIREATNLASKEVNLAEGYKLSNLAAIEEIASNDELWNVFKDKYPYIFKNNEIWNRSKEAFKYNLQKLLKTPVDEEAADKLARAYYTRVHLIQPTITADLNKSENLIEFINLARALRERTLKKITDAPEALEPFLGKNIVDVITSTYTLPLFYSSLPRAINSFRNLTFNHVTLGEIPYYSSKPFKGGVRLPKPWGGFIATPLEEAISYYEKMVMGVTPLEGYNPVIGKLNSVFKRLSLMLSLVHFKSLWASALGMGMEGKATKALGALFRDREHYEKYLSESLNELAEFIGVVKPRVTFSRYETLEGDGKALLDTLERIRRVKTSTLGKFENALWGEYYNTLKIEFLKDVNRLWKAGRLTTKQAKEYAEVANSVFGGNWFWYEIKPGYAQFARLMAFAPDWYFSLVSQITNNPHVGDYFGRIYLYHLALADNLSKAFTGKGTFEHAKETGDIRDLFSIHILDKDGRPMKIDVLGFEAHGFEILGIPVLYDMFVRGKTFEEAKDEWLRFWKTRSSSIFRLYGNFFGDYSGDPRNLILKLSPISFQQMHKIFNTIERKDLAIPLAFLTQTGVRYVRDNSMQIIIADRLFTKNVDVEELKELFKKYNVTSKDVQNAVRHFVSKNYLSEIRAVANNGGKGYKELEQKVLSDLKDSDYAIVRMKGWEDYVRWALQKSIEIRIRALKPRRRIH